MKLIIRIIITACFVNTILMTEHEGKLLNPIQDGPFGAAHGCGVGWGASLSHISYNDKT